MLIILRVNLLPLIQRQKPSNAHPANRASLCLLLYPLQEEKKGGRAWIVSKLQVAASQTSVSVNIVFFRRTRFFESEHLFINKPTVKTIPRARLLGLELNLYPSNKQRMPSKDLTRHIKSLCRVRQNRVSKRKELLAGCQTPGPGCSKLG